MANLQRGRGLRERSAVLLVFLQQMPRWTLLVVTVGLLAIGLVGTGWVGALALLVLAVFLAWFAFLSWPAVPPPLRLMRVAAVAVLTGLALARLTGRF